MKRPRWMMKYDPAEVVTDNKELQQLIFELAERFEAAHGRYGAGSPEYLCFKRHQQHFEQIRRLLWRGGEPAQAASELEWMMQDFRRIEARATRRREGTLGQHPARSS